MTRRDGLGSVVAVSASAVLGGCGLFIDRDRLKFRMNVIVDTPAGPRIATSVMEAVMTGGAPIYRQINPGTYYVRGEAPHGEIAPGAHLFVPLGHPLSDQQMLNALQRFLQRWVGTGSVIDANWRDSFPRARDELPSGELSREEYPLMVTFGTVKRPASVKAVTLNDFPFVFGAGYLLRSVEMEIVPGGTPLSSGLADRFPEIAGHSDFFNEEFVRQPHGVNPEFGLSNRRFVRP